MKRIVTWFVVPVLALGLTLLMSADACAKGGCFPAGTRIQTPRGDRPIERLVPGDEVIAIDAEGAAQVTNVEHVYKVESPLLIVRTSAGVLRTTAEHPLRVADGRFLPAGRLQAGDQLVRYDATAKRLRSCTVLALETSEETVEVFNLSVGEPHTFVADGFVVHNKGCFPAGTRIQTPRGDRPIEQLVPGDEVIAIDADGAARVTRVEHVYTVSSPLLIVRTSAGVLRTTAEHPLRVADGRFLPAGSLQAGDQLVRYHANAKRLRSCKVLAVETSEETVAVFNLSVGAPHTFIADGFVVHNKGGHSSHGSHGSHGSHASHSSHSHSHSHSHGGHHGGGHHGGGYYGGGYYGYYYDDVYYGDGYYRRVYYYGPPPPVVVTASDVLLQVQVPANAKIMVNGDPTTQTGSYREFISSDLTPGKTYAFTLKAEWDENGQPVARELKVRVQGGERRSVNFLAPGNSP
jgi:uncharacterized protein (TIGR03000 family)